MFRSILRRKLFTNMNREQTTRMEQNEVFSSIHNIFETCCQMQNSMTDMLRPHEVY